MVEVTNKNFDEQFKVFHEKLKSCTFVAFDEEMTGIRLDTSTEPSYADSPALRYQKMRKVASTFNIMQQADGSFVGTPYNFFVFPPESSGITIQMDSSTAQFHRQNCMNFNKWVYDGIPFLPNSKYSNLREKIEESVPKEEPEWKKRRVSLDKAEDKEFMEFMIGRLDAWVAKTKSGGDAAVALPQTDGGDGEDANGGGMEVDGEGKAKEEGGAHDAATTSKVEVAADNADNSAVEEGGSIEEGGASSKSAAPDEPSKGEGSSSKDVNVDGEGKTEDASARWKEPTVSETEFIFPDCNAFLRKALYQEIGDRYPSLALESRQVGENRYQKCIVATIAKKGEVQPDKNGKEKEVKLAALDKDASFRRVYAALIESKKPLVGHNCLFDLLFLYSHLEGELPESYTTWKEAVHALFPIIFDTKVVAARVGGYDDTMLGTLYKAALAAEGGVSVTVDPAHAAYTQSNVVHEAGFDAWMTGVVFARIGNPNRLGADSENANYLALGRSFYTVNLAGEDQADQENGVLHVSEFPKECVTADIMAVVGHPKRLPLHVKNLPKGTTGSAFKAHFQKIGPVVASVLVPAADSKSHASGFVVFENSDHVKAAAVATHGTKAFGGDDDPPVECEPLRVAVRWVNDEEAFLLLSGCSESEALAALDLQPKPHMKVVSLSQNFAPPEESKAGGRKRGRTTAAAPAEDAPDAGKSAPASKRGGKPAAASTAAAVVASPPKGGRRAGKAAAAAEPEKDEEEPAPAPTPAASKGKGKAGKAVAQAAAEQPTAEEEEEAPEEEEVAPAAKGGRKRGRAEAAAPSEEAPKKVARGEGRKAAAESAAPEAAASPAGKGKDKANKGKDKAKGGKCAAAPKAEEEEAAEEQAEDAPAAAANAKAKGAATKKKAVAEEDAEEKAAAAPSKGKAKGGKGAAAAAATKKATEEKDEEEGADEPADKEQDEEEEEEEEHAVKGAKGKHAKGAKGAKAAPKEDNKATTEAPKKPSHKKGAAKQETVSTAKEDKGKEEKAKEDKKGAGKGRKEEEAAPSKEDGGGRRSTRSRH